jgi:3-oxoadipate enol-lactonase
VLPAAPTQLLATGSGQRLEFLAVGRGRPVTVFAHGLGGGIPDTRPLGSGVPGRKVFVQLRGHGRSTAPPGPWTYADLAADLGELADAAGATRALGVSLGAAALCRLLADRPDRFDRLVFFRPAVLDTTRPEPSRARLGGLLAALRAADRDALVAALADELPVPVRDSPAGRAYLSQRAAALLRHGLAAELAGLADQAPVPDVAVLRRVQVPALVLGCRGDDLHPAVVAERLAAALPRATLHLYDQPGVLWTARADLRERIAGFLAAED